jgi:hypothetical protein
MMLDGSDATDDVNGAVDVVVVGNVGMFAHLQSSGTVHNTAHLNGNPVTSSLVALTVNDNARTSLAVSAVSSPACNGTPTGFSLSGCTVQTDASHTASVSEVVTLSNGMYSIDVTVNTWVPSGVTMSVVDAELNLATPTTASCVTAETTASSETPYTAVEKPATSRMAPLKPLLLPPSLPLPPLRPLLPLLGRILVPVRPSRRKFAVGHAAVLLVPKKVIGS